MQKILILIISSFICTSAIAQYDAFSFQALILDEKSNPIPNALVEVRTTISSDRNQTDIYYQESQSVTSSEAGTIDFSIGEGERLLGKMVDIDWLAGVPYIGVEYNLLDGKGWQETGVQKFKAVPFCLESRYIVCQDGDDGQVGATGPAGWQGPVAPIGQQSPPGAQGAQGRPGVPVLIPLSEAPDTPQEGRVYLDDGTNTGDSNPGFMYFDGTNWIDL